MNRIRPDNNVMINTTEYELISHEKAIVRLDAGCLWTYLLENNVRVGIAFVGPSRFAVDAIAETKMGAMGESFTGSLVGIQLYVGASSIESISKNAEMAELQIHGFQDATSFLGEVESTIQDQFNGDHVQTRIETKEESQILFGRDANETKLLLVLSKKKGLVFTYGKQVFVFGGDKMVSVSKSGIVATDKHGKQIVVGKGGIHGVDSFLDIGPIVTESVTEAMKGLKGLKSIKSMKKSLKDFPYDNVDDFDWDD